MKDIIEQLKKCNTASKKEVFDMLKKSFDEELKKGTDLSQYLKTTVNVTSRKYVVSLEIPIDSNIFDASISNGK